MKSGFWLGNERAARRRNLMETVEIEREGRYPLGDPSTIQPSRHMLPTPREIFTSFERGELERDELHALMALHARELIQEMEEDHQNPAAAWIENLLARRASGRLVKLHSARLVREVLVALADVTDFPPTRYLWNASHPDIPIRCFFRMRREPVFRILSLEARAGEFRVVVEYGVAAKGKGTRQAFLLARNEDWKLKARIA